MRRIALILLVIGAAVAGGDVTGDGCPDLLYGVPGYGSGHGYAGLYGCAGDLSGTTAAEGADARFIETDAGSKAGAAVHASADLDGNGRAEVIVGAPENNGAGPSGAGAVYVVFGKEL
ncbi:MAG: hypothetical protein EDQ89_12550 [Acidobacteria bacterium]|nr:MAG: hypothetical protein EDQ89_12550 [Acidobacteriota bacterium]